MEEQQNLMQIKMEKAEERLPLVHVPVATPPSPLSSASSSSTFPNNLDVTQLKDDIGKLEREIRECNKVPTLALKLQVCEDNQLKKTPGLVARHTPALAHRKVIKKPEEKHVDQIDGDSNGGAAGASALMEMEPRPSTSTACSGACIQIGGPVAASSSSKGMAEIGGPRPGTSGSMLATGTTVTTAVEEQDQDPELEFPTAAEIAASMGVPPPYNFYNLKEVAPLSGMGEKWDDLRRSAGVTLELKKKRGRSLGSIKVKGAKKAKCTICGKGLKNRASLKGHQIRMHGKTASGNAAVIPDVEAPEVGQAIPGTSAQVVQLPEIAGAPPNEIPEVANEGWTPPYQWKLRISRWRRRDSGLNWGKGLRNFYAGD